MTFKKYFFSAERKQSTQNSISSKNALHSKEEIKTLQHEGKLMEFVAIWYAEKEFRKKAYIWKGNEIAERNLEHQEW